MTYSKNYNPEKYVEIQEILDRISSLRRGEKLVVEGLERGELMTARGLLYDWFSHLGVKKKFRISMEWEGPRMVVRNVELGEGLRLSVEKGDGALGEFVKELIEVGEERAGEVLEGWMNEGKLTEEEAAKVLSKFSKAME